MKSRMSRGLYWFLGITCVAALVAFGRQGYSVRVNSVFSVNYIPEDEADGDVLRDRLSYHIQVKHVEAYANLGRAVAGRAAGRFFVADADKKTLVHREAKTGEKILLYDDDPDRRVSVYEDYASWLAACQRLNPTFRGELVSPSRFRDPQLVMVYAGLVVLLVLWLVIGCHRVLARRWG